MSLNVSGMAEWCFTASFRVILESDPQQVVHRVALRVCRSLISETFNTGDHGSIISKLTHETVLLGGRCAFDRADSHPGKEKTHSGCYNV